MIHARAKGKASGILAKSRPTRLPGVTWFFKALMASGVCDSVALQSRLA